MSLNISAKAVEQQIAGDINACLNLLSLLDDEQVALKEKNPEALAEIVERKIEPLSRLEQSAKTRSDWAKITDKEQATESWREFINEFKNEKIKDDWQKLKELTKECQHKNEVNGKILVRHQQVYGRLLDLLRGQNNSESLYNAYGAATSSNSSLKLDEV